MNPFFQSLIALIVSVLLGSLSWKDAIAKWLQDQIAALGSREAVEGMLSGIADGGGDCSAAFDDASGKCCAENPGKFGDGRILDFLRNVDWAKFAQFIMTIIAVIPKSDPAPGPIGT